MQSETKTCQNCKKDFVIEPEDFNFYEKMQVPPPTFCRECRLQRRLSWRNERTLYKRTCDLCKKRIISAYDRNVTFPVYCRECWYGDAWDAASYGRECDFSRPFFEQLKNLFNFVPQRALWQRNSINSDYSNMVGESRNIYLSVSVIRGSENIFYSKFIDASFNIFDSYSLKKSDSCYENIDGDRNYNSQHVILSRNCIDSLFLIDCVNCTNCFMSYNLRNKEFYIHNKKYSKEEYEKQIKEFNLGSRKSRQNFINEFQLMRQSAIYRYANNIKCVNSTGNNLLSAKNCKSCFDVYDSEDSKYCYRAISIKDCMDFDYGESELMYEYITGALNDYNVRFSCSASDTVQNAEYIDNCISSTNIFGCFGIKSKQNVILNKVYSKEKFTKLREKIINHMNEMPYIDKRGNIYKYGEFFPIELSPHAYNESLAQDFFPLSKTEALERGYGWHEPEEKKYSITLPADAIPDNIKDIQNEIMKEVIGCEHKMKCDHQCLLVFRITPDELQFYKKNNIPIPSKCPNCRYYERFVKVTPLKLWRRQCVCKNKDHGHDNLCPNEFETPYSPEKTEIIYCESCYNKEVY